MEITHSNGRKDVTNQDMEGEEDINLQGDKYRAQVDTIRSTSAQEFVVDEIILHEGPKHAGKYTVRWYGYSSVDDIVKPTNHIPQNFIDRYWRKLLQSKRG